MKKLYFLDEEEKNRVLSLHEGAKNKQYLKEDAITDFEAKLPQATKDKFTKMKLAWEGMGTNEQGIVDALNSFTGAEYNLYNQYLALKKPEGVTSIQGIINAEMGYANTVEVDKVVAALKRFGLTGTYQKIEKDKQNNKLAKPYYKENTFKITKGGAPAPVVQEPVKDTNQPVVDRKKLNQQQLASRLKQTQISLGLPESGALDNATLQAIITKLSPRPQVQPVLSGQPAGIKPLSSSSPTAGINTKQLDTI